MRKKVLVLGANFGGLTAALAVRHELDGDVDVTVVSASDHFLFNPSLIWLPFGKRDRSDITFPVAPTLESHGIDFVHAAATGVDPVAKKVTTDAGQELDYDYLVIATGYRLPAEEGGPAQAGATHLRDRGAVPRPLRHRRPAARRAAARHVLEEGGHRDADQRGRPTYQSEKYDDVYAVGVAAAVDVPWQTPTPVGIPKTGFPTEVMTHTAAANIAAQVKGEVPTRTKSFGDIKAVCVMDAGNNGVIILADKMLPPRKHGVLIPGPQAHLMKLGFEKYFLWKMRHGHVQLP